GPVIVCDSSCGRGTLCEERVNHFFELPLRPRPDEFLHGLAVLEKHDGRDAHHLIATGNLRILVRVQLHDLEFPGILIRQFLDDRGHHLARAAPDGPEIHHHQTGSLHHVSIPASIVHLGRLYCHSLPPLFQCQTTSHTSSRQDKNVILSYALQKCQPYAHPPPQPAPAPPLATTPSPPVLRTTNCQAGRLAMRSAASKASPRGAHRGAPPWPRSHQTVAVRCPG